MAPYGRRGEERGLCVALGACLLVLGLGAGTKTQDFLLLWRGMREVGVWEEGGGVCLLAPCFGNLLHLLFDSPCWLAMGVMSLIIG